MRLGLYPRIAPDHLVHIHDMIHPSLNQTAHHNLIAHPINNGDLSIMKTITDTQILAVEKLIQAVLKEASTKPIATRFMLNERIAGIKDTLTAIGLDEVYQQAEAKYYAK